MTSYNSAFSISNDPADLDYAQIDAGTATVWPPSRDAKLTRSPRRQADGEYLPFDGGAVYRRRSATFTAIGIRRDISAPSLNTKSKTKAAARAVADLALIRYQDERLSLAVDLPSAVATKIKAGMAINFRSTYLPGYGAYRACRIVHCQAKQAGAGSRWILALELVPIVDHSSLPQTPVTGGQVQYTRAEDYTIGTIYYENTGDAPHPGYPTVPLDSRLSYVYWGTGHLRGFQVDVTEGALNLNFIVSSAGAYAGAVVSTARILVNSVTVAENVQTHAAGFPYSFVPIHDISASNVPVESGYIIEGYYMLTENGTPKSVTVPSGGINTTGLVITGGTLTPT